MEQPDKVNEILKRCALRLPGREALERFAPNPQCSEAADESEHPRGSAYIQFEELL